MKILHLQASGLSRYKQARILAEFSARPEPPSQKPEFRSRSHILDPGNSMFRNEEIVD